MRPSFRFRLASCLPGFRLLACLFAATFVARAADTPVKPPAIYTTHLAAMLTPVEQVLHLPHSAAVDGDSGETLLDERLVYVAADGRKTMVWHVAYKTLTDAGVQTNGEDVYRFRKHDQQISLVLAETIQPDGTHQSVQPNAVLIQSPQRQAEYSLYDDQEEMKVIFPNVKPGSVTHLIVVIQELEAKIPGEFTHRFVWGGSWAKERMRYSLELPAPIAARLKNETVGTGVPKPTIERLPDHRVLYRWSVNACPGQHYEISPAPPDQVGPAIHLSSLGSWDDVAHWYQGLLRDRGELSPELVKQAAAWTHGAKSRAEIIAALHARVADDVRYVGLEFGAADYQPHACSDVWTNRYGDCKDKANLLAALLRHCGIVAYTALVNTGHLGLVDPRTPDYHVFTHAIVAIPEKAGGYLFCDPTIGYSVPGMLGVGDSDRDVLVVTDHGAQWVHTPAPTAGSLHYDFDLKLAADGGLSGWMTLTSDGYYGASERDRFTRLDTDNMRTAMSDLVRGFYPAAEVIDTQRVESARDQPYVVKAYFTVAGTAKSNDRRQTLVFPSNKGLFVDVGSDPARRTTFAMTRDYIRVTATIHLPGDYAPDQPLRDFAFTSPPADVRAAWKLGPRLCQAELDLTMKRTAVRRDEFAGFYRSIQAAQAWIARPLVLQPGTSAGSTVAAAPEFDFPLMPSGNGQIDLADKRYPEDGDPDLRRRALERTIEYFPKDKETVFRAGVRLAIIDWNADRNEAAHQRLAALLTQYAGQLKPETYAWGDNIDGLALRDLKRDDEALSHLERIARNRNLSSYRRAVAGVDAADLIAKKAPAKALDLLLEIDALPDGATDAVEARIAQLYLTSGKLPGLRNHLRQLVQTRPDTCEEELTKILAIATKWPNDAGPRLQHLVDIVRSIRSSPGEALAKACATAQTRAAMLVVHGSLVNSATTLPLSAWVLHDQPKRSFDDYKKATDECDNKNDAAGGFRLWLAAALEPTVDDNFSERLWQAANYADWTERQGTVAIKPEVADLLLDLCDQLPKDDDYFCEGRFLRAKRIGRTRGGKAELAALKELHDTPGIAEGYRLVAARTLARRLIELEQDYKAAVELYRSVEPLAVNYRAAADSVLRETFIDLHLGQDTEALRCIDLLSRVPESTLKACDTHDQIRELVALVKTGRAPEVWKAGRAWWPQWRKFVSPVLGSTETDVEVVPAIASLKDLGTAIGAAKRDGDAKAYFRNLGELVSAARWLPSLASEVGGLYTTTAAMTPDRTDELRKVVIAVLETPHPPAIANWPDHQLQLAINYFDGGRPADTLKVVARFAASHPPDDAISHSMHRMRALAALAVSQEVAPAATDLEGDLSDPHADHQRAKTAGLLADLYGRLGRQKDQEGLLKKELANPIVAADVDGTRRLKDRLDQLVGEKDFNRQIEAWRTGLGLDWYDYAEPFSLDDPRLANLEEALRSPPADLPPPGLAKLQLLAAEDIHRPLTKRRESLRYAISWLAELAPTYSAMNRVATSVIENKDFDESVRVDTLRLILFELAREERKSDYERWRKNPLYDRFSAETKASIALLDRLVAVDRTSPSAVLSLAADLSRSELSRSSIFALDLLFGDLIRSGDLAAAEKFVAFVPAWRLSPEVTVTVQTKQLDYARQLRLARLYATAQEQLIAATVARYPALADELPKSYRDLRFHGVPPMQGLADTRQACLYLIKTRRFPPDNFFIWYILFHSIGTEPGFGKFAGDAFAAGLHAAGSDTVRSQLIGAFANSVDLDEPDIRAVLARVIDHEIDPVHDPAAYLANRRLEIRIARRLGRLADLTGASAAVSGDETFVLRQLSRLRLYTQSRSLPEIRQIVDSLKTDVLVAPGNLWAVLPALETLGDRDELVVVREVARAELRRQIVESWARHDDIACAQAVSLAEILHDPTLLPAAWVSELSTSPGNPYNRQELVVVDASLRADWPTVAKVAATLIRGYPTYYHTYWYLGLASAKLGHKKEAVEALRTYVRYAKDELQYPEANELLSKLAVGTAGN